MNILLLGETGVGKSTFINGLATYFTYPSLTEALKNPFEPIIPVNFKVANNTVKLGADSNEDNKPGTSATQKPRTYILGWNSNVIRVLDTLGNGDTRGVEQDKINFARILEHIKHYNYIHGICILLKSDQNRITPFFKSCIMQLLSHLHQDAINNIAFVVTHGVASDFDPAVSIESLKTMLARDLEEVDIPLNESTVYCVDNVAVKFLAQKTAGVAFLKERLSTSAATVGWEETYPEINRLFSNFRLLTPHDTTKTYSLNHTRKVCLTLGTPLAETTGKILIAQADISKQKDSIIKDLEEGASLQGAFVMKKKIYRKVTDNKYEWMICSSSSCGRLERDDSGTEIFIPRYCKYHEATLLSSVVPSSLFKLGTIASAGLFSFAL
ncbi:uncharacterized protein LOC110850472 [Folsomia candida]|uniref:Transaminated amino acid decarboxylase n=1 Tax=Folsomia candida TaxID=158441 RepID=A0A226EBF1_FOLCA|nr:uncharacterized protein LOC110850472 [Folsomia candida]OXA54016.1 Transaminated amino acid decarboxylase [Folsomia candida]